MKQSLFLILFFFISSCESMSFLFNRQHPAKLEVKNNSIYLNGILGKTAYQRIKKTLTEYPDVDTLIFVHSNGSLNDDYNIETAKLIHEKGIITKLLPTTEIASGAVDLFLAGKKRIVPKGAKIGIHSWKDGEKEGKEYPKESKEHELFWKYYEMIGIDTGFYWYTLRVADFDEIYWMKEEEIEQFKVRSVE